MRLVYRAGLALTTAVALLLVLFPFYWAFLNSIKRPEETFQPSWIPFLQFQPTLEHWRSQLAIPEIRHALLNSTISLSARRRWLSSWVPWLPTL